MSEKPSTKKRDFLNWVWIVLLIAIVIFIVDPTLEGLPELPTSEENQEWWDTVKLDPIGAILSYAALISVLIVLFMCYRWLGRRAFRLPGAAVSGLLALTAGLVMWAADYDQYTGRTAMLTAVPAFLIFLIANIRRLLDLVRGSRDEEA